MLFSISESGRWLIAVGATAVFALSIPAMTMGVELPDGVRRALERRSRMGLFLTPVFAALPCSRS